MFLSCSGYERHTRRFMHLYLHVTMMVIGFHTLPDWYRCLDLVDHAHGGIDPGIHGAHDRDDYY